MGASTLNINDVIASTIYPITLNLIEQGRGVAYQSLMITHDFLN